MPAKLCGVPDSLVMEAGLNRWNKRRLTWTMPGLVKGITAERQLRCRQSVFAVLSSVCGLTFEYVASGRADITMNAGVIDGRNKTLAWSQLANGSDGPLQQMYELDENWSDAAGLSELSRGQTPLFITTLHEVGHALGLGHSPEAGDVMAPALNLSAWVPGGWMLRELLARYGTPKQPDGPPAPTTPAEALTLRLFPDLKLCELPAGWTGRATS